jgi:SAM-dependent methyltransferase
MDSSKNATRPCPVCGSRVVFIISKQNFELPKNHPLPSAWDVVSCPICHFAYADTAAYQETYDYYYSDFSKYEHDATSTGGGTTDTDRQRLEDTAALIAKVVKKDDTILDLGCANGGLLVAFKKLGFTELTGLDPSPACALTTSELGVEGLVGSLFEPPVDGRKFKAVILCHVLEHIRDLQTAAEVLRGLVADDGYLYVEVPDASRYGGYSEAPFQDFNVEHINHFAHSSLSNLFESKGFITKDQGIRDIPSPAGWVYPAIWCLFKIRPTNENFDGKWLHNSSLKESLDRYTLESIQQIEKINHKLATLVESQAPVIVWGTGQFTLKLLAQSTLGSCNIIGFIDSNPGHHGKQLRGIEIFSPEILQNQAHPVIIGSLLHHQAIENLILAKCPNPPSIIKFI